jgi:uncharacterized protein
MKVAFSQLSACSTQYSIKDTGWFPVEELILRQLHHAKIDLLKRDNETAVLKGEILASVEFFCDRCGEPFEYALAADFFYLFKTGRDSSVHLQDMECSEEDCSTVYLDEPVIDVGEVLREQVLLAAPVRRICDEACRGLCSGCGAILAHDPCRCLPDRSDSPFAVLNHFKKHRKNAG